MPEMRNKPIPALEFWDISQVPRLQYNLEAVMKGQTKTPGAMALVERALIDRLHTRECRGTIVNTQALAELRAILDAPADHIEDASAMVEQTPAVGGEPKVVAYLCNAGTVLMLADQKNAAAWNAGHPLIELEYHCAHVATLRAEIERMRALLGNSYSAGVALSKEIDQLNASTTELEAQIAKANDWSHLKPDMDPLKQ